MFKHKLECSDGSDSPVVVTIDVDLKIFSKLNKGSTTSVVAVYNKAIPKDIVINEVMKISKSSWIKSIKELNHFYAYDSDCGLVPSSRLMFNALMQRYADNVN